MRLTLKVIAGPHQGNEFTFEGRASFVVGRHKKTQFRLSRRDPYLSRFHFCLELTARECLLLDLGSANHTYLNEVAISRAKLSDGDVIRAGHSVLKVSIETGGVPWEPPVASEPAPEIRGYRIDRLLGSGQTGDVYLAIEEASQARVALKMIAPAIVNCRQSATRFEREAVIMRQLEHRHVVSLFGEGRVDARPYQVMEYVAGSDAHHLLEKARGPLPIARGVVLVRQALDALGHAHRAGVVHRDIKPSNLLVARIGGRDFVKLGDFGIARVYRDASSSGLTREQDVLGTIGFLPPEQILDLSRVGPRSDLYGAGATLYSLLTGQLPYDFTDDEFDCFAKILDEDPRDIRDRRPDVPAELAEIIHMAMARDPDNRFPDAGSMRKALKRWVKHDVSRTSLSDSDLL
jgi:serine/threonine-protein kinase